MLVNIMPFSVSYYLIRDNPATTRSISYCYCTIWDKKCTSHIVYIYITVFFRNIPDDMGRD